MNNITNAKGQSVSYNEIKDKQEQYAKRKMSLELAQQREDKNTELMHRIRSKSYDSVLNMGVSQIAMHAQLQPVAEKLVAAVNDDMSLFEVTKLVEQKAQEWVEYSAVQEDNQWFTPLEHWGVNWREAADNNARYDKWMEDVIKLPQYGQFYVVANMPAIGLKFDTREKVFTYDKAKRKNVKNTAMAVYDNYNATKWSVINKILMKIGYSVNENDSTTTRNDFLRKWLKENMYELTSSFAYVPSIHNDKIEEFPALIFSLSRSKNSATNYVYDPSVGISQRLDQELMKCENSTTKIAPLSYYELEDHVIKGNLDATNNLRLHSIEDAFNDDSRGARGRMLEDLPEGIDAYASLAMSLDRMDLVEHATDANDPQCVMDEDIAQAVWDGGMLPSDASILWGNLYMDRGVQKQGLWLRKAFDMLTASESLSFDTPREEKEYYQMQVIKLGLNKNQNQ